MGCPCREIRQVISHIPGVRNLLGLLPDLPNEGQSAMKMTAHPGFSVQVTSGTRYTADDKGIIHNVMGDDRVDLRNAGCQDHHEAIPQKPLPQRNTRPQPRHRRSTSLRQNRQSLRHPIRRLQ
jgi:hypothetical protein